MSYYFQRKLFLYPFHEILLRLFISKINIAPLHSPSKKRSVNVLNVLSKLSMLLFSIGSLVAVISADNFPEVTST